MAKVHQIATGGFQFCDHQNSTLEPSLMSSRLILKTSSNCTNSWAGFDGETPTATSRFSSISPLRSGECKCISCAARRCNAPIPNLGLSCTPHAVDSHTMDTTTFPQYAAHYLPSEPNGMWHTQVRSSLKQTTSTLREVLEQRARRSNILIDNQEDDICDWVKQKLAGYNLVEVHSRFRQLLSAMPIPTTRHLSCIVDTMAEIVQSLWKCHPELTVYDTVGIDKYDIAHTMCNMAIEALMEQGICKSWQLSRDSHAKLRHSIRLALVHTFAHIRELQEDIPLLKAKPIWSADRQKKSWHLELDVGIIGIEVGPESDRSLVELGLLDTGFELHESRGVAPIVDIDRQMQVVEDDWQLLEG